MSNLDPFTQKLLERTQARKEAARKQGQHPTNNQKQFLKSESPVKSSRVPLADKNGQHCLSPPKKSAQNKRRSEEGIQNSSFEKKQKPNENADESLLFPKRQKDKYVVPSSAGRTPKKVDGLASRLASLNRDYEERFQIDSEEEQRHNEAQQKYEEKKKEHQRILEEEKAQRIQEKIFGKNYKPTTAKDNSTKKPDMANEISGRPSIRQSSKTNSTSNNRDLQKQKEAEERKMEIVNARKATQEEEKMQSASVGDKMSIFEQKMKEEREAREQEIQVQKRLQQKTPRQQVVVQAKEVEKPVPVKRVPSPKKQPTPTKRTTSPQKKTNARKATTSTSRTDSPVKRNAPQPPKNVESPSKKTKSPQKSAHLKVVNTAAANEDNDDVEIDPMLLNLKSPAPAKSMTGMRKHYASKKSSVTELNTGPDTIDITPVKSDLSSKNYTGDLNSPQPKDYTEDTTILKDSTAFDISEILRVAEEEKIRSPPASKTPHRSSTMKVQASVVCKPLEDIDLTPTTMMDESTAAASEFTRQLRSKKKQINTPYQAKRLAAIDDKIEQEAKKEPEKPVKPPRAHTIHEAALPPSYNEFIAEKKENILKQIFPDEGEEGPVVEKPVEITPKENNIKRSNSFTLGHTQTPVKKSGYHGENGDLYTAKSNFSDKPDLGFSKRDQIQNLLEEAAYQQNIVLQTSQALNVAESSHEDKRGSPEVVEGERLLLLATEKRTVCLEEVRQLKQTDSVQYLNELTATPPCKATLALTDMKIPLHSDFVQALRNGRIDLGIFHFVVIVSCGSKNVYSSKVISTYDEMEGNNLLMHSNILMSNVPHDFTLNVKVFGLHTKKLNDPHGKLKRTYKKDDEISSHASPQTVFRTSNFKLVGETKINLNILGNGGKHILSNVPSNCPIEGFIQMRVSCKPEFTASANGFLTVLEDVGGYTAWNRRWCNMKDNKVLYWRYPDDEETKDPLGCIDLRFCTDKQMSLLSRDKCARPHTFELNIKRAKDRQDVGNLITTVDGKYTHIKHWVCADNKDDRKTWMDAIDKQLNDSRAWLLKHATKSSTSSSSSSSSSNKKSNDIISNEHGKAFYV